MQVLNWNNHSAIEISAALTAFAADYTEAGCKDMSMAERAGFIVGRWCEMNREEKGDRRQRDVWRHLFTALAYMGDPSAVIRMERLAHLDAECARESGDAVALAKAEEEQAFWQTVLHEYANGKGDSIHVAYQLLYGIGCERDVDRAREIYGRKLFERYDTLDEAHRNRLRDARDGKLACPMPEMRRRTIDALLSGDRAQFSRVFNEAVAEGKERDVDSVWGMMSYLDKIKEKEA